jgi:2-oxoisovalerate dehydrogenase E1 component
MTPLEMLLQAVGSKDDPNSGGRQMPSHWGSRRLNIMSQGSPTGTQCLQAVGLAEAGCCTRRSRTFPIASAFRARRGRLLLDRRRRHERRRVLGVAQHRVSAALPVVYLIEDNGYAISVPAKCRRPAASISRLVESFPNLKVIGATAPTTSSRATAPMGDAVDARARVRPRARAREGGASVLALAVGRRAAVQDAGRARGGSAARSTHACSARSCATRASSTRGRPRGPEPTWIARSRRHRCGARRAQAGRETAPLGLLAGRRSDGSRLRDRTPQPEGKPDTMVAAINRTLHDEMRHNPRIVVFGEDVADASKEARWSGVGQGWRVQGHARPAAAFGGTRVFNSPLAEANIVGRAVGMATRGIKPVVEIQFFDYIWPAMMQIRDEMSMLRYRSAQPVLVPDGDPRADRRLPARRRPVPQPVGREHLRARARAFASRSRRTPRMRPGLLRTAIRCDDPVMFLEHKHLYRQTYNKGAVPGPGLHGAVRQGRAPARGSDVLVITYGALVQRTLLAAQQAAKEGSAWPCSTCARSCPTTGRASPRRCRSATGSSSRTRTS